MARKTNVNLLEIYKKYQMPDAGGDKGTAHSYMPIYAKLLKQDADFLEIGVWEGHSLAMFSEFFTGEVIGLDIDISRNKFGNKAFLCNAISPKEIKKTLGDLRFDYVIDDGSHRLLDQKISFALLWEYLKPGGIYFIEDIMGIAELQNLKEFCLYFQPAQITEWDLRANKNRYDDILLAIQKVE